MSRRKWTPTEDATLQALLAQGKTNAAIARMIKRPESSVYSRAGVLANQARPRCNANSDGLPQPTKTRRPCMCCQTSFISEGPHHRLCGRCRGIQKTPFEI